MEEINKEKINEINSESYNVELNSTFNSLFMSELSSVTYDLEQIKLFLKYPMTYNRQIRKLSRELYGLNGIYGNTIDYMTSIPSLNFITRCFKSGKANEKKKQIFNDLLKKIHHKTTSRDIILNLLLDGVYVGMMRDSKSDNVSPIDDLGNNINLLEGLTLEDNIMIQPLPIDYIKIEGFQNNEYVVAFDMQYFDSYVGNGLQREIRNFPKDFVQAYMNYKKDGNKRYYRLNQKKTIVLKFKSSILEPWGRPLCITAINDMIFSDQYKEGLRSNLSEVSSSIRWLKQPESDNKGKCSLNKEQQQNQYDNFKNAIFASSNNKAIGRTTTLVFAPGTEVGKLDVNTDLLKDTLTKENETNTSTGLGFAAAALNGAGENGASYSSLQVNIDLVMSQIYTIVEQISEQYTKVVNNILFNSILINMSYLRTSTMTQERDTKNAKDLYTLAGGSRIYWVACSGIDVEDYISLMDYELENKFDSKYLPHPTSFTLSGKDAGRPTNGSDNPNAEQTKTNGGNKMPKPSQN